MRENKPYIELFRKFLRTEAYESFIQALKLRLQDEGIKTVVFDSILPHHFVACMWTAGRRTDFAKRAEEFEGVVVLGCDALVRTVFDSIKHIDCRVIQGMEIEGIMTVVPTVSFPLNISLKMQSITSVKMEKLKE